MVDTKVFLDVVRDNGMTLRGVAKNMGISYMSLYRKSRNASPIRLSEVEMFCKIVGVSTKAKRERIFLPSMSTTDGRDAK